MLAFPAMIPPLYSIRMRASLSGRHLSGAERLATADRLDQLAAEMVRRALEHDRGRAEEVHLSIEALADDAVQGAQLPDLQTFVVSDYRCGRDAARKVLLADGVSADAAARGIAAIAGGAGPAGRPMRGAMLIDARSGDRLEPDRERGVRVSRMDLTPGAERALREELDRLGLDNLHVREALVLAGKVLLAPSVVAELCWSDDPGYTAGYVAVPRVGYTRFPHLKPAGEERGGRAFFITPGADLETLIRFLEKTPVLFDRIGQLRPARDWEE
jgi:6-carboxyhexanoate--CoA ligase